MQNIIDYFFSAASFVPHGYCLSWRPDLVALHAISDFFIFASYFSIPLVILLFVRRRTDFEFSWAANLFILFIAFCGLTHLAGLVTLWQPYYGIQGMIKLVTAGVSVLTAIALWRLFPHALALPSPTQLRRANESLADEVRRRQATEEDLRQAHTVLEERVRERTRDLEAALAAQRDTEEALRKSEQLFRDAIEALSEGFAYFDADDRLQIVNQQYREKNKSAGIPIELGLSFEALLDAHLAQPGRRNLLDDPEAFKRERIADFRNPSGPRQVRVGDDLWLQVHDSKTPDGGTVSIHTDISALKRAERQLEERAAELERSNRELDDFAYIVSHDLKAPLRGISNTITFALEDHEDELPRGAVERLENVKTMAARMDGLLDDLLAYSRVGRAGANPAAMDLGELLRDVGDDVIKQFPERTIEIRVPADQDTVRCRKDVSSQIMRNLLTNAVKYNEAETVKIDVAWQVAPDGGMVKLSVSDNGIGIEPRHQDQIFDIFRRLHGPDEYGGGTGAGLSIVKKLVEKHGGEIGVESGGGHGTTFWFTFPNMQSGQNV